MKIKIKRITDCLVREMNVENFYKNTTLGTIENKAEILRYLKSFEDWAFTSEPVYDILTGKKVADADNAKTDGIYTWYQSEIYHFENYNIRLNNDFIQYVTSNKN